MMIEADISILDHNNNDTSIFPLAIDDSCIKRRIQDDKRIPITDCEIVQIFIVAKQVSTATNTATATDITYPGRRTLVGSPYSTSTCTTAECSTHIPLPNMSNDSSSDGDDDDDENSSDNHSQRQRKSNASETFLQPRVISCQNNSHNSSTTSSSSSKKRNRPEIAVDVDHNPNPISKRTVLSKNHTVQAQAQAQAQAQVKVPTIHDIICGKKSGKQKQQGNLYYRKQIYTFEKKYKSLSSKENKDKRKLVCQIYKNIKSSNCRFMEKIDGQWVEWDEIKAKTKISQALREKRGGGNEKCHYTLPLCTSTITSTSTNTITSTGEALLNNKIPKMQQEDDNPDENFKRHIDVILKPVVSQDDQSLSSFELMDTEVDFCLIEFNTTIYFDTKQVQTMIPTKNDSSFFSYTPFPQKSYLSSIATQWYIDMINNYRLEYLDADKARRNNIEDNILNKIQTNNYDVVYLSFLECKAISVTDTSERRCLVRSSLLALQKFPPKDIRNENNNDKDKDEKDPHDNNGEDNNKGKHTKQDETQGGRHNKDNNSSDGHNRTDCNNSKVPDAQLKGHKEIDIIIDFILGKPSHPGSLLLSHLVDSTKFQPCENDRRGKMNRMLEKKEENQGSRQIEKNSHILPGLIQTSSLSSVLSQSASVRSGFIQTTPIETILQPQHTLKKYTTKYRQFLKIAKTFMRNNLFMSKASDLSSIERKKVEFGTHQLSSDTFSLMMTQQPWTGPWNLSFFIYIVQITLIGMLLKCEISTVNLGLNTTLRDIQSLVLLIMFTMIRSTDITIPIANMFVLWYTNYDVWSKLIPQKDEEAPSSNSSDWKLWTSQILLPNILKLLKGVVAFKGVFLILVKKSDVILNVAAIHCIADLDNLVFILANLGYLGVKLQRDTKSAKEAIIGQNIVCSRITPHSPLMLIGSILITATIFESQHLKMLGTFYSNNSENSSPLFYQPTMTDL